MPSRVTYWTGRWDPSREGHSREIEALRRSLAATSLVISFATGQRTDLRGRDGVVRVAGGRWALYRALQVLLEPWGRLTHVFGALSSWEIARVLGRRPLIFTATLPGEPLPVERYARVTRFAVEAAALARKLRAAGVDEERICVIHPGVDLTKFTPRPPPVTGPFRLLFASSPASARPEEFGARGVPLLVELARRVPEAEVLSLWRPWDDEEASRAALAALDPPGNFRVVRGDVPEMAEAYGAAHAVVIPFREGFGKVCPNSLVEALACGRPALVAEPCGVAELLEEAGAGIVRPREAEAMAEGLRALMRSYESFAARARPLAEKHFGLAGFLERYRRLYEELAAEGPRRP